MKGAKTPTKKAHRINSGRWTSERIRRVVAHLSGKAGEEDSQKALARTINFYAPEFKFSTKSGRLFATNSSFGKREIVTRERAEKAIK